MARQAFGCIVPGTVLLAFTSDGVATGWPVFLVGAETPAAPLAAGVSALAGACAAAFGASTCGAGLRVSSVEVTESDEQDVRPRSSRHAKANW